MKFSVTRTDFADRATYSAKQINERNKRYCTYKVLLIIDRNDQNNDQNRQQIRPDYIAVVNDVKPH